MQNVDYSWLAASILFIVLAFLIWRLMRAADRASVADWGHPWLNRLDGLNRLFCRWYHRLDEEVIHLPKETGQIVVSNHISGVDGNLLLAKTSKPLRFIIAREQYERPFLNWVFRIIGSIPVDRSGRPDKAMAQALEALKRGEAVALFPQGTISVEAPKKPLKRGVTFLASRSSGHIHPFRISGVGAPGENVRAVFIRSRAVVHSFEPLFCDGQSEQEMLDRLKKLLFDL